MKVIEYPKCTTCQRACKWLNENEFDYEKRDIKLQNPTKEELKLWYKKSGLPLKRFFNTSGMVYREKNLKDRLPNMSEDEMLDELASNGMLVKRPIVLDGDTVLVGFKKEEWEEKLLEKK